MLLPFSSSLVIPRQMFGVIGLNPFNVSILLVIITFIYRNLRIGNKISVPIFMPLFICYLLPFIFSAFNGLSSFNEISPYFLNHQFYLNNEFPAYSLSSGGYLLDMLIKPLILVFFAYVIAICVATFGMHNYVRIIVYLAASLIPITLFIGLVSQGLGISEISTADDRRSLSWFGMHANELGLMLNIAFALVLFGIFHEDNGLLSKKFGLIIIILLTSGIVVTFSRGAFLAYFIIIFLYIARSGFSPRQAIFFPMLILGYLLIPDVVFERLFTGVEARDIEAISAGRFDLIWMPLFPVILENIFIGGGLGSVMWSQPMQLGAMLPVGHPHSAYLGLLLDLGIFGTGLVICFWWYVWRLFDRVGQCNNEWRGFFIGAKVSIIVLFFQGITDDRFTPTASQSFLWIAVGLAIGMIGFNKNKVER